MSVLLRSSNWTSLSSSRGKPLNSRRVGCDSFSVCVWRFLTLCCLSPAASKEDLLTMIQHGADTIFKEGNEGTIVDEDIEEILAKGEAKTAQLEDKFKDAGIDDLQRLTFNSTMVWEGEDYRGKVVVFSFLAFTSNVWLTNVSFM